MRIRLEICAGTGPAGMARVLHRVVGAPGVVRTFTRTRSFHNDHNGPERKRLIIKQQSDIRDFPEQRKTQENTAIQCSRLSRTKAHARQYSNQMFRTFPNRGKLKCSLEAGNPNGGVKLRVATPHPTEGWPKAEEGRDGDTITTASRLRQGCTRPDRSW